MLVQLGADDAELAGGISTAGAQIHLTGDKIKVDPGAVLSCQDTLSPENHTVGAQIQFFQAITHKVHSKLFMGLGTPGSKDLVGMVMVVMIMAAAVAMLIVTMMMVMFMIVVMMMLVIVMMVFMVMIMAAASTIFVMLVVMMLSGL